MQAAIAAALDRHTPYPFVPVLERLYLARRVEPRRRRLGGVLCRLVAYDMASLLLDALAGLADLRAALVWRAVLGGVCIGCGLLMRRATRPWHEAVLFALPCLGVLALTVLFGEMAPEGYAVRYCTGAVVSVVALLVVAPVGYVAGLATALATSLLFPALLWLAPGAMTLRSNLDLPVFACGALAVAALTIRRMETGRRRAFLQTLRYELAATELNLMNAELRRLSATDVLTGLANRRHFEAEVRRLWDARAAPGIGLALIDVDHFKAFNDSAGHAAGDACLREVAGAIATAMRDADELVARYGGEEFVVVFPRIARPDMATIGERLRLAVEARGMPHPGRDGGAVTISVGVAWHDADSRAEGVEALLRDADRALYAAKRAGRNRVAIAPRGRPAALLTAGAAAD